MSYYEAEDDPDEKGLAGQSEYGQTSRLTNVPDSLRNLRACLRCMLIKTYEQFYNEGCENCHFLELAEDRERIQSATTANFDGFVAVTDPKNSWVAKWCRVDSLTSGCYAVKVSGEVPPEIDELIQEYQVRNIGKLSQEDN